MAPGTAIWSPRRQVGDLRHQGGKGTPPARISCQERRENRPTPRLCDRNCGELLCPRRIWPPPDGRSRASRGLGSTSRGLARPSRSLDGTSTTEEKEQMAMPSGIIFCSGPDAHPAGRGYLNTACATHDESSPSGAHWIGSTLTPPARRCRAEGATFYRGEVVMRRFVLAVTCSVMLALVSSGAVSPASAQQGVLSGTWTSVDIDGSSQQLRISGSGSGRSTARCCSMTSPARPVGALRRGS
jgi:hypothetical protein